MEVRCARPGEREAVLGILEEGFADDPFVAWVTQREAAARRRYLELVHDRLVAPRGEVWVDAGLRSAALWVRPGAWELSLIEQLRLLPRVARVVGFGRLGIMARASARIEAGRPARYWYLALLATRPGARRKGLGRAVMAPILRRCDREGELALLETSHPPNVRWYRGLGFEVRREIDLGQGAPRVWAMERRPR